MTSPQPTSNSPTAIAQVEASGVTSVERFQTADVLTLSFAHWVHDTYSSFVAPLLPSLIPKLSLSMTEAGLLEFSRSAPSLLQPIIGHIGDRVSLRYLVILAPAVTATMMSLLGVAPRYAVAVLLVLAAGLSSASLHAVAPAMAGRLSGRRLGRGMGLWMVGGSSGFAVGPILIVSAVNFLSMEGTPWLMIGGWGASVILYLRLRKVAALPATPRQAGSWREGLQALRPLLVPLVGVVAVRALMVSAVGTFLPTFLTQEGASLWFAGMSLSVLTSAGWAGALLGGSLSDRLGRRVIILVSMLCGSLLMLLFLTVSGWVRLPVLLLIGITGPAVRAVLMALVQESCPENRALANGLYLALTFTFESGAAVVMGALGDLVGLRLAFTISALILLLGLPVVSFLPGRRP